MTLAAITTRRTLALSLVALGGWGCAAEPEVAADEPETEVTLPVVTEDEPAEAAAPVIETLVVAPERWAELKAEIRGKFPGVDQLSVAELGDWLSAVREPPVLLDVREAKEYAVSHLEGALLARDEAAALEALGDAPLDRPVVLYCSVGYRSSALAEKLEARGYTSVHNLEGSIFEWVNRGQPIVSAGTPVKSVHPYDTDWGQLLRRDFWAFERAANDGERSEQP